MPTDSNSQKPVSDDNEPAPEDQPSPPDPKPSDAFSDGPSSLLIDEPTSGLAIPYDEEPAPSRRPADHLPEPSPAPDDPEARTQSPASSPEFLDTDEPSSLLISMDEPEGAPAAAPGDSIAGEPESRSADLSEHESAPPDDAPAVKTEPPTGAGDTPAPSMLLDESESRPGSIGEGEFPQGLEAPPEGDDAIPAFLSLDTDGEAPLSLELPSAEADDKTEAGDASPPVVAGEDESKPLDFPQVESSNEQEGAASESEETDLVFLDDVSAPETATPDGDETVGRSATAEAAPENRSDDRQQNPLLISDEDAAESSAECPSQPAETADAAESAHLPPPAAGHEAVSDLISGESSLLLGKGRTTERRSTPPAKPAKRKRARPQRERLRGTVPKPGRKVQWFSNPDACQTYCRKHRRPLLIYFSTGDADQCRTYEAAIRLPEMQPFLTPYVCCLVNMARAGGADVARRFGVPSDSPGVVILAPSGREFARVLKPEIDWQFLATMLFWALR